MFSGVTVMSKLVKLILSLTVVATVALPSFAEGEVYKIASVANNMQRDAMIVRIATGKAYKKAEDGQWLPIAIGSDLLNNDVVKTAQNSTILIELPENAGFIRVMPETELKVNNIKVDRSVEGGQIAELSVVKGKVITKVRKFNRKSSKLQINTKGATAAVRGTSFLTSFDENNQTKILVGDGKVLVKAQNEEVIVKPQEVTNVAFGGKPTLPAIVDNKLDFVISEIKADNGVISVSGKTDPDAEINLDKSMVFPNSNGSFSGTFPVQDGENKVSIKSSTIDGRTKISSLKIIKLTD